jgi:hypothetical protein
VKGRKKNKRNPAKRARAQLRNPKADVTSTRSRFRALLKNPATKKIIADEAELQRRITADPQLTADFEFLLKKLGWPPSILLKRLYWNANVMHADRQTLLRQARANFWPLDQDTLKTTLENILAVANQIEMVNQTDLSPVDPLGITLELRNKKGVKPNPRDTTWLLKVFRDLPDVLRAYYGVLAKDVESRSADWPDEKKRSSSLADIIRTNSLYEHIRLADPEVDEYNSNRLRRLVNASRGVLGLPTIELRAFVKWLNELKKWAKGSAPTPQAGQVKEAVN